jgi:DNA invertase Pin-like site-specific DNA recombinase
MPIPAAQYLRMSTEHQQYSLQNQSSAIERYAEQNGFVVVQTYEDGGKSGLVLKHRVGLSRLLQDVVSGTSGYKAILVYDVSRWGRFEGTDEAPTTNFSAKMPASLCITRRSSRH